MEQIRTLAPTIIDAVKAVEQGIRKIQSDNQFRPRMWGWLAIGGNICFGCLATSTLMQLTNKTGNDIYCTITKGEPHDKPTFSISRAFVFDIVQQPNGHCAAFNLFEVGIDGLRQRELLPLLSFYGLEHHPNALTAIKWLVECQPLLLNDDTTKATLLQYADFLHTQFIPQLEKWFPVNN